jgi:cytochrome c-type biogenesis protein CcmH/NrfF
VLTVVLFAAAVVLITAGAVLMVLDNRRRTHAPRPDPKLPAEPPAEPGSLFRDTYDHPR